MKITPGLAIATFTLGSSGLAFSSHLISNFEGDTTGWSVDPTKVNTAIATSSLYPTDGAGSLQIDLPAADMWYSSAVTLNVDLLDPGTRTAAFATASELSIDFTFPVPDATYDGYPADHALGFIILGDGLEWTELGQQAMVDYGVTTTATFTLTPAQASVLAEGSWAQIVIWAKYGNGSGSGNTVYFDQLRTDVGSPELELLSAQASGLWTLELASRQILSETPPAEATFTLVSQTHSAYSNPQTLNPESLDASGRVLSLSAPEALAGGHQYTLTVADLAGAQGEIMTSSTSFPIETATATLSVDALVPDHRISPYIYGVAFAPDANYVRRAGITVNRWGGNHTSAFNWEINATNLGNDWYFMNTLEDEIPEAFIARNAAGGAATQWSLASLPWIAKDTTSNSFAVSKYGPQQDVEPFDADHGNGRTPEGDYILNDFTDALKPNLPEPMPGDPADAVYQSEFLTHLAEIHGDLFPRLVPFVAIDNEMDIWRSTHADAVHEPMSYEDIRDTFLAWAGMVRAYAPHARIMGPVSTGWYFYWNSSIPNERSAKGMGLVPWFLEKVRLADEATGVRSLDVLDLHYYPESGFQYDDAQNPTDVDAWKLRSTREWWDTTYTAEGETGRNRWWAPGQPNQYAPAIIPRMKELIETHYPGTSLAITEWNYGPPANGNIVDGLTVADTLGIFGAHQLDFSTMWTHGEEDSAIFNAFALFRNPAADGRAFGSFSLPTTAQNVDEVSIFASLRDLGDRLHLVLINKDPTRSRLTQVDLPALNPDGAIEAYRFDALRPNSIQALRSADIVTSGGELQILLSPYSATHVIIPLTAADSDSDGMPDVWESYYGGTAGAEQSGPLVAVADAGIDHDGDGFTSGAECEYGSNPLDPAQHPLSAFLYDSNDGSARVYFYAPFDRAITLEESASLDGWTVGMVLSGTDGWVSHDLSSPPGNGFYRLIVR